MIGREQEVSIRAKAKERRLQFNRLIAEIRGILRNPGFFKDILHVENDWSIDEKTNKTLICNRFLYFQVRENIYKSLCLMIVIKYSPKEDKPVRLKITIGDDPGHQRSNSRTEDRVTNHIYQEESFFDLNEMEGVVERIKSEVDTIWEKYKVRPFIDKDTIIED